jgi:hypothetical protein
MLPRWSGTGLQISTNKEKTYFVAESTLICNAFSYHMSNIILFIVISTNKEKTYFVAESTLICNAFSYHMSNIILFIVFLLLNRMLFLEKIEHLASPVPPRHSCVFCISWNKMLGKWEFVICYYFLKYFLFKNILK